MAAFLAERAVNPGRSGTDLAREAARTVDDLRRRLDRFFNNPARDPDRCVFTANATDALNLAIAGLCRPGDHVVSTVTEHNSVLRPLHALAARDGLRLDLAPCDGDGRVDPGDFARLPAAGHPAGGGLPRLERLRHHPAGGRPGRRLPGAGRAPAAGCGPVRRLGAGGHGGPGRGSAGLHRAQGAPGAHRHRRAAGGPAGRAAQHPLGRHRGAFGRTRAAAAVAVAAGGRHPQRGRAGRAGRGPGLAAGTGTARRRRARARPGGPAAGGPARPAAGPGAGLRRPPTRRAGAAVARRWSR